jgi:hypothetical protein
MWFTLNREVALGYVAAMIDGEGSISPSSRNMSVRIGNTDPSIIEATCEALDVLEIEYSVLTYANGVQSVNIYRLRNFKKLAEVPIRSAAKIKKLQTILVNHKGDRLTHNPDKEELQHLVSIGLTDREIAEVMGFRSHSNLQFWRKKFNIQSLVS